MNKTTLETKLFMMFFVMFSWIAISLGIYFYSIDKIKNSGDDIFNKGLKQVTTLHKLNEIYSINILDTLKEFNDKKISYSDSVEILNLSTELVKKSWENYKNEVNDHKKRKLIEKIEKQNSYIFQKIEDFDKFSTLSNISPHITALSIYLDSLIELHLEKAREDKKKSDKNYNQTVTFIAMVSIVLFLLIILLLKPIITNIRKDEEFLKERIEKEVEKNRAKSALIMQQSKMTAMSELVNSLSHQWRQPLNSISLLVQNIELRYEMNSLKSEELSGYIQEIDSQITFMSDTINQFVSYIKGNKIKNKFYFREVLEKSQEMLSAKLFNEKIDVSVDYEDFSLNTNRNGFLEVIVNILKNSIDAFGRNNICENRKIYIETKVLLSSIELTFKDNAGGMDEKNLSRATEPYFTTDFKERGKGLGLYIVKMVIEEWLFGNLIIRNNDDGLLISITIPKEKD